MHMYAVEQALARVCRAYQGTRPAAKIAQEQAKAGICSLASACKHRKSSLIFEACSEVRYFYRGHDLAFTLTELKAQFRIAFEAFRTQNLYRRFFCFDLRMKDFYFKLRENWLIQYFTQMFGFFNVKKRKRVFTRHRSKALSWHSVSVRPSLNAWFAEDLHYQSWAI